MQRSALAIALVSALVVLGAGVGGALALSTPTHQQESTPGTTSGLGTGTETSGATTGAGGMTTAGTGGPSVTFDDQNTSGDSVLVESATLPQNGFVVIYDSTRSGNETDQIIGESYLLNAGTSDNVRIQLDEPINSSKSLTAVVHTDTNDNGQFDYVSSGGQQDTPLMENGRRIVDIAEVSPQNANAGGTQAATSGSAATSGANESTGTAASGSGNASGGANNSSGSTSSNGPGFGPAVALVALLAAALLALRRR